MDVDRPFNLMTRQPVRRVPVRCDHADGVPGPELTGQHAAPRIAGERTQTVARI